MASHCSKCKNKAESFLQTKRRSFLGIFGVKQESLCHEHLIEEFSKAFKKYPSKMVVFPPYLLKSVKLAYSYDFYPVTASKHLYKYDSLRNVLAMISGQCQSCYQGANVAIYDKKDIAWRGDVAGIGEIDSAVPKIVCKACAINLIVPYLNECAGDFTEGFNTPFGGEGWYMLRYW